MNKNADICVAEVERRKRLRVHSEAFRKINPFWDRYYPTDLLFDLRSMLVRAISICLATFKDMFDEVTDDNTVVSFGAGTLEEINKKLGIEDD